MAYKFYGPYTILEKFGAAGYKLDLPEGSLIHPVFHISQLKEFTPDYKPVFFKLPMQVNFSKEILQPEAILERRLVKKGNAPVPQVCVKWERFLESVATWEDWHVLNTSFPMVASWGQTAPYAGGGVTPSMLTDIGGPHGGGPCNECGPMVRACVKWPNGYVSRANHYG
jgi:hypothetical protein